MPMAALAQRAASPQDSAVSQDTNAIIVTARRRAESLQTTPVAITASARRCWKTRLR
jgi:iron complex outermembrane receptor protein